MENLSRLANHVRGEFSKVIVGQRQIADQLLTVLVCGGHALIEGVPGIAKTLAVKTMSRICGLGFQRDIIVRQDFGADLLKTKALKGDIQTQRPIQPYVHVTLECSRLTFSIEMYLIATMPQMSAPTSANGNELAIA